MLKPWGKQQHIRVFGLENVALHESGLFAVKHAMDKDLPVVIHSLPRRTVIMATERIFQNPIAAYVLRSAGVVPLYVALREKPSPMPPIDVKAFRTFYETLESGWWVAYTPEATQVPNAIGKTIFPQMLMKAAARGHLTYIVGISYGGCIDVRIEQYDARHKPKEQVVSDIKERFARLSGLENAVNLSRQK